MGLFSIFKKGLQKTATAITRGVTSIFKDVQTWDESTFTALEHALVEADFGIEAAKKIKDGLKDRYDRGLLSGEDNILEIARNEIADMMRSSRTELNKAAEGPTVILMVGVNGSGKTTTAGKLAWILTRSGKKVVLGACDTFRAAASEQLKLWAERTGSGIVASKTGADPAAVAFDAVSSAIAQKADYLIIDTAGRQQNRKSLMDELAKMRRIIAKLLPDAPHETLLTLDTSMGMNMISQAKEFSETSGVTGVVLTKLDGTGKGGCAVRIQSEFQLPVLFAGFGEQPEDLQEFNPDSYASAMFGMEEQ
ncbi:MAG: signal recognition particle-docking protein FtsY [Lentisphaeria bacterium]|nr:signal recognition particle-docking protein FtsY [Lentisphaeria bacterium]